MVAGLSLAAVTKTSDVVPVSTKEFLDIQATIECKFILKHVHEEHTYTSLFSKVIVKDNSKFQLNSDLAKISKWVFQWKMKKNFPSLQFNSRDVQIVDSICV